MRYFRLLIAIFISSLLFGIDPNSLQEKKRSKYETVQIDKKSRKVTFQKDLESRGGVRVNPPKSYVNCTKGKMRRFKGRLLYWDGEIVKLFPIMDETSMNLWYTNHRGEFDFELPGNCHMRFHGYGERVHTSFGDIPAEKKDFIDEIMISDTTYLIATREIVPDKEVESALTAGRKLSHIGGRDIPSICISGSIPSGLPDFHLFGLDEKKEAYYSAVIYDDLFDISVPPKQKFKFIAYSNKTGNQVQIFHGVIENVPPKKFYPMSSTECYTMTVTPKMDMKYSDMKDESIIQKALASF